MMNRILITGGAGFIGSKLATSMIKNGYEVTILDNMSEQIHGVSCDTDTIKYLKRNTNFIIGDVRIEDDWQKALAGQDVVVHLAAETGTGQSMYEIEKYTDTNINGTSRLLDILVKGRHQVKKLIIASSRAIYGEGKYFCEKDGDVYPLHRNSDLLDQRDYNVRCPICNGNVSLQATDENSKIHPSSIYGITKQNQEQMAIVIGRSLGIATYALRYQNVYGPGQSLKNPYTGILSIFTTRILNNNPINIFEDGLESRDFVYIDDVVNATKSAIECDRSDYLALNIGAGVAVNVLEVVDELQRNLAKSVEVNVSGDYRVGDIRHNYAALTHAAQYLNYKPCWEFKSGIIEFVKWAKQQEVENDNFDASLEEMSKRGLLKTT